MYPFILLTNQYYKENKKIEVTLSHKHRYCEIRYQLFMYTDLKF